MVRSLIQRAARFALESEIRALQHRAEEFDRQAHQARAAAEAFSRHVDELWARNVRLEDELRATRSAQRSSYSWEGEDVVVNKICLDALGVEKGFFIDVGANHPMDLSNTFLLYSKGWRGINIDATPGSMELFRQYRPEDINLEVAIGPERGTARFHLFADNLLNGFLSEEAVRFHTERGCPPVGAQDMELIPLTEVVARHAPGRRVDLLNIDAEGLDLQILRSASLDTWRPTLIITEVLHSRYQGIDFVRDSEVAHYLATQEYLLFSRLHFSAIFLDARKLREIHRGLGVPED